MNAIRWSDSDAYFGPLTYAKDKYGNNFALVLGSGDDEDYPGCRLRVSAFGHTIILALPPIIRPWRRKVYYTTLAADELRQMAQTWYWDKHEREYGFSYSNDNSGGIGGGGFLQVFLGAQTHDSSTTQSWSASTPWNNWRHVRHSYYDLNGNHFWTEEPRQRFLTGATTMERGLTWEESKAREDSVPTRTFCFTDFDGEFVQAKTRIEEREWRFGTKWFRWLSVFRKPIIHRSLDIDFSGETGKRKGSWKGGTTGHSIEMKNPDELHGAAFIRYCAEHEMKFVDEVK
jgi:hypothetical protein